MSNCISFAKPGEVQSTGWCCTVQTCLLTKCVQTLSPRKYVLSVLCLTFVVRCDFIGWNSCSRLNALTP